MSMSRMCCALKIDRSADKPGPHNLTTVDYSQIAGQDEAARLHTPMR